MKQILIITLVSLSFVFRINGQTWSTNGSNIFNANSGNVGIGISSPTYKFEVVSPTNAKLKIYSNTSPNSALLETNASGVIGVFESLVSPAGAIRAGARNSYDFNLFTNNVDRLTIKTDGKVGIGKPNPAYTLDVNGQINATSLLVNGVTAASKWTTSVSNIYFNTGNVGIGTTLFNNPNNYKLAVNGKLGAKEVVIETNTSTWPDYVFNENYKLPTLSEVETFIKVNKHLPEIPSANTIGKQGINVAEMDAAILKKVEELTLYLIQLKNENDALKVRVSQLENKSN